MYDTTASLSRAPEISSSLARADALNYGIAIEALMRKRVRVS